MSEELEEKNDWNTEVDDKADHSNDISFLSKLLPQSIGIVNIITRRLHHQEARIEREAEGNEGQKDSENDAALLVGPGDDSQGGASHAVPSAKDCHERAMFALLINYWIHKPEWLRLDFKNEWPWEAHVFLHSHLPPYEGTKADSWISNMCSGTSKKLNSSSGRAPVSRD